MICPLIVIRFPQPTKTLHADPVPLRRWFPSLMLTQHRTNTEPAPPPSEYKYEYTNTKSLFARPSARTNLYKIQFIQKYNVKSDNYHTLQYCSLRSLAGKQFNIHTHDNFLYPMPPSILSQL